MIRYNYNKPFITCQIQGRPVKIIAKTLPDASKEDIKILTASSQAIELLVDVLSLARLKWGNLDKDANEIFEKAEKLIKNI